MIISYCEGRKLAPSYLLEFFDWSNNQIGVRQIDRVKTNLLPMYRSPEVMRPKGKLGR